MPAQEGYIYTLPSRILLATDLSDLKQILPVAIDYALKSKSALKLVHVLSDISAPDSYPGQPVHADGDARRQHAEKTLEDAAEKAREVGLKCSWTVCTGQVDHTIMQLAQEWKADRVVVGTFCPQKLHQELLGAVAESILREVDVPVLAVGPAFRDGSKDPAHKTHVLLATALDRESIATTESVVRFAKSHRAELTMLHVIPEIVKAHPSALRVRAYAESKFHEILSGISGEMPPISCLVERGPVVETILRVASEGHFDLIVFVGVSESSFRSDIMPGIAYGVICGAPCPVLVLKQEPYRNSSRLPAA